MAGDPGEGDGKYTESIGLANFYANDAHGIISRRVTDVPGRSVHRRRARRIDILSDGGVRDLFNFAAVANHFTGQLFGRRGADGLPLRSVAFYNGFHFLPGEPAGQAELLQPVRHPLGGRRGHAERSLRRSRCARARSSSATATGSTSARAAQLLYRLETAFFFAGNRWTDADRRPTEEARENPRRRRSASSASTARSPGTARRSSRGRARGAPAPSRSRCRPGYALKQNVEQNVRYPVLYVLHGYGQDPRDLEAVAVVHQQLHERAERSYATRLPKFIIVYVDGRCRVGADGKPECIRGTFYMNSARPDGAQLDEWFDEVTEYVDQNYRTMPPSRSRSPPD